MDLPMNNGKNSSQNIKRFSIYWFNPDPGVGAELRKIRPCLVVSPDEMNKNLRTVLVAPLTSTVKPWPSRVVITVMNHSSSVALDQLRAVDKSRLKDYISALTPSESQAVLRILQEIFA